MFCEWRVREWGKCDMKNQFTSTQIFISFCVCFSLLMFTEVGAVGEILEVKIPKNKDNSIAILEMLSAEIKSNVDQIETWSGRYNLTDKIFLDKIPNFELMAKHKGSLEKNVMGNPNQSGISGRYYCTQNALIVFLIRTNPRSTFSAYEEFGPKEYLNLDNGKSFEIDPDFKELHYSVLDASGWRSYNPVINNKEIDLTNFPTMAIPIHGRVASIRDAESKFKYSYLVDPIRFFGLDDVPFYESLESKIKYIKEHGKAPLTIERKTVGNNELYVLTSELRIGDGTKEKPYLAISTFSSDVGFNAISNVYLSPDGKKINETKWEYLSDDGIFLPSKYHFTKYKEGTSNVFIERLFTLSESKINEEIGEDSFTWEALGITEGDRVRDNILDKDFRYDKGKLIPPNEYDSKFANKPRASMDGKDRPTRGGDYVLIIALNLGIIILFGIFYLLRKKRA